MKLSQFEINKAVLPNGLKLVHTYDGTVAMAAVDVLYNVGSRDESRNLTGMAHLFEHLMFGGSVNVDDYDGVLSSAGGVSNAWTSSDFTNFYETLPAQNLETAFYLESDRMLGLSFNEQSLEVQRGVVIEEFKQTCLDVPYGDCFHRLRRLIYASEHPYSWPTIGLEPEHVAKVTIKDVRDWFYSHYAPNNAILSVSGNISFEKTLELTQKWFGDIPSRQINDRIMPSPGFPQETIVENISTNVPVPMIVMAIPMDCYGTRRYYAADIITDLLSAGKSSRFNSKVLYGAGKGLITDCDASIIGSEHEGMLLITARISSNQKSDFNKAADILLNVARELALNGNLTPTELERCFNAFESNFRFTNNTYLSRAQNIAMCEYHGETINDSITIRKSLSASEIAEEADCLFNRTPYVILNYGVK